MIPPPSGIEIGGSSGEIVGDEIESQCSHPHSPTETIASGGAVIDGEQMSARW